jgi:hypothetical protein
MARLSFFVPAPYVASAKVAAFGFPCPVRFGSRFESITCVEEELAAVTTHLPQVPPSVIRDGEIEIEIDFSASPRLHVADFDRVTIACPIWKSIGDLGSRRLLPLHDLPHDPRVTR